jgi:hypothetical protein
MQTFDMQRFSLKKEMRWTVKNIDGLKSQMPEENFSDDVEINMAWKSVRKNIKISQRESRIL